MTQKEQEVYQKVYDFLKVRENKEFIIPFMPEDEGRDKYYCIDDIEFNLRTDSNDLYGGCAETVSVHRMYIDKDTDDVRFDLMYIFWDGDGIPVESDMYICEEAITFEEYKDRIYSIDFLDDVIKWIKEEEEENSDTE